MDIGGVHIESKLALAPMAGVTDLAFRTICREAGAGYTYTEMVSWGRASTRRQCRSSAATWTAWHGRRRRWPASPIRM